MGIFLAQSASVLEPAQRRFAVKFHITSSSALPTELRPHWQHSGQNLKFPANSPHRAGPIRYWILEFCIQLTPQVYTRPFVQPFQISEAQAAHISTRQN